MKKLVVLFAAIAFAVGAFPQENREPIMVKAYIGYGYNYTYRSYANIDVRADIPINEHFELDASFEECTANIFSVGTNLRPKFALPVGEMYVETKLLYKAVVRNSIHDFNAGLSLGYRMDYVDVQIGMFGHLMSEFHRKWNSEDEIVTEPISMLYRVNVYVRPQASKWNLNLGLTNFDDYIVERFWQPMFFVGGRYNINERMRVLADVEIKPTGMFHLDASFYGIKARVGLAWLF